MKIDWKGVVAEIKSLSPALRGRLIRHVLTLLAGVGLFKGLSAEQTNALQGLIELGGGIVLFVLSIVLSHGSDEQVKANAAIAPLSEQDLAKLIDEARKDSGGTTPGGER